MYATVAGVLLGSSDALRDPTMPQTETPTAPPASTAVAANGDPHVRVTPDEDLDSKAGVTASGALQMGEHHEVSTSENKFVVGSDGQFWDDAAAAPAYDSIEVHELSAKGDPNNHPFVKRLMRKTHLPDDPAASLAETSHKTDHQHKHRRQEGRAHSQHFSHTTHNPHDFLHYGPGGTKRLEDPAAYWEAQIAHVNTFGDELGASWGPEAQSSIAQVMDTGLVRDWDDVLVIADHLSGTNLAETPEGSSLIEHSLFQQDGAHAKLEQLNQQQGIAGVFSAAISIFNLLRKLRGPMLPFIESFVISAAGENDVLSCTFASLLFQHQNKFSKDYPFIRPQWCEQLPGPITSFLNVLSRPIRLQDQGMLAIYVFTFFIQVFKIPTI